MCEVKNDTDLEKEIQKAIEEYTNRYCIKHGVSKEEAKNHIMIKLIEEFYHENPPKDISVRTELDIGCKGGC